MGLDPFEIPRTRQQSYEQAGRQAGVGTWTSRGVWALVRALFTAPSGRERRASLTRVATPDAAADSVIPRAGGRSPGAYFACLFVLVKDRIGVLWLIKGGIKAFIIISAMCVFMEDFVYVLSGLCLLQI